LKKQEKYKCYFCPACNWIGNQLKNDICPNCGHNIYDGFFSFKEPQWLRTDDPIFVAFLDILGFKNLVMNNTISSLFQVYDQFLKRMENSKTFSELSYSHESFRNSIINSLFVSDSLILWTEDFSQISLYKLTGLVSMLIAESFLQGTPVRGAIDLGEIAVRTTWTNQTIVGKGLTNAYESEESQEWAGCLVSERCIEQFNKLADIQDGLKNDYLFDINLLIHYPIPVKGEQSKNNAAVNWTYLINKEFLSKEIIAESFNKYNKDSNDNRTQKKIDNTLKFYDFTKNKTIRDLKNKDF